MVQAVEAARTSSLMDLVREFPDTTGALDDLRTCLELTGDYTGAVDALRAQYAKRLLQPGANTQDIIEHYIAAIKAFRYVEPAGIMLEQVSGPVREYLRARDDTIRCILVSFTDTDSELYEEFMQGEAPLEQGHGCVFFFFCGWLRASDNGTRTAKAKTGHPIRFTPRRRPAVHGSDTSTPFRCWLAYLARPVTRRTRAFVESFFFFPSAERFVSEYRRLLADRLLRVGSDYGVADELTQLEMFKLRFGEAPLHEVWFCVFCLACADSPPINSAPSCSKTLPIRSAWTRWCVRPTARVARCRLPASPICFGPRCRA